MSKVITVMDLMREQDPETYELMTRSERENPKEAQPKISKKKDDEAPKQGNK